MPLFDETPSNAPVEPVKEIVIDTTTVYQGDTTVPTGTTLSGSPWVLKAYYSQYMSKDDYPRLIDFKLDPTLQQYVEIENFVLLMTESFSQDEDDNHISTIKGTATFYPGIVPNQWDMMVGPMSDGSMGVFTIPDVPKRAKYHKYTSHTAVIEFIGYYDEVYAEQFRIKSVDRLVFDPDNPGCPAKNIKEVETESADGTKTKGWEYEERELTKEEFQEIYVNSMNDQLAQARADIDFLSAMTGTDL